MILIISDDLNDYIELLGGHPQISTPNISQLAEAGISFTNAFSSSPGCAPSRTSMLSGKDVYYTGVFNNNDYTSEFRENFNEEKGNEVVFTLPEILKDSGGYFTYAINKIFHNPDKNDFDKITGDACAKSQSWNRMTNFENSALYDSMASNYNFLNGAFNWGSVPDSLEKYMEDYRSTDTAAAFFRSIASGSDEICNRPFFLSIGYSKPHTDLYIPEKYFPPYYKNDFEFNAETISDTLFNYPFDAMPFNGIQLPVQPNPVWNDYYNLGSIAMQLADGGSREQSIIDFLEPYSDYPLDVKEMVANNIRAADVMAYIAAVQFMDTQVGRLLDSLSQFPSLYENTIVIFMSDHGFSLGEKRHWGKWGLWETDIRVPMIIYHPELAGGVQIQKAVSYLDIFPTICGLTNTPLPRFENGEIYTDGIDISTLLLQPELQYELPAVTSYKRTGGNGSCFPHYSIRNERFHYIRYQNNNADTINNSCDYTSASFEEEFYDIGLNRETDPFEWNNLHTNEQYRPMMQFLSQWIPDSNLYLSPTLKIIPAIVEPLCLSSPTDSIFFSAQLYDATGVSLIDSNELFETIWFATWMDDTLYGQQTAMLLQDVYSKILVNGDGLVLYAAIILKESNEIVALNLLNIYKEDLQMRNITFETMALDDFGLKIFNIVISGEYNQLTWSFGDGGSFVGANPPVYYYLDSGTYAIQVLMEFGDGCTRTETHPFTTLPEFSEIDKLIIWPIPSEAILNATIISENSGTLKIVDLTGREVQVINYNQTVPTHYQIDISKIADGVYYIYLMNDSSYTEVKAFIVAN